MTGRHHSLPGIPSPLPYFADPTAGPSRIAGSFSSHSSSSSTSSNAASPFRASISAHPRDSVPSPTSSERESQSPTAAVPHPPRPTYVYHSQDSSSSSSQPPPPKPYKGGSTPFPLPVGKRSLGGLAALDEQMQAATLGRLSDPHSRAEPARLGTTRCYWTLLNTRGTPADPHDLTFMFCDPVLQSHMGSEKDLIIGKSFFDFVHPQERAQAKEDLRNIVASRTLFGSVTRCRYFRVPAIRETLGCANPPRDAEAHLYTSDDCYLPLDIVINMVGESIALCFFHAVLNKTSNDNNEANKSHWTNWCGTPRELYDVEQCNRLWSLVASQDLQPSPKPSEAAASPSYVFQVLSMPEDNSFPEIIFSWPPPRLYAEEQGSDPVRDSHEAYDDGSYFADEFARLAQGVRTSPSAKTQNGQTTRNGESGTIQDGANTSCTRRFRAKHTLTTEGMVRSIESVLVPYGTVMLACFNTTYQQKMTRASVHRDLSPARAYTGMPFAPNARVMYQSAPKRNRGVGSPPGEVISGGMPLTHDSVVTHSGEAHWPPAVTRPHPLPAGVDPRDPYARPIEDSQRRQQTQQASADHTSRPPPASYSKRKTASEESAQAIASSASVSPTSSGAALAGRDEFAPARRGGSGGQVGSPRDGEDGEAEKRCTSCGTSNSPEWRKGPTGQKTLCNACGLRFSRSVSRQQKKEGKARAEQQQKEQAQRSQQQQQQQQQQQPALGAEGDVGQQGAGGPGPPAVPAHYGHYPPHSSTGYPYTQSPSSSSFSHYNSHYQIIPDGAGDEASSSPYAREAGDVPYVGYGHHTARRIAAMGWGTPPGQSKTAVAASDAPRPIHPTAGGYDGHRVRDGRVPEGYGVNSTAQHRR